MTLNTKAKEKLKKITYETGLSGFSQFNNKGEAIRIINKYHEYMNDNGTFKKNNINANCDPIYQRLSAAIDYYKFDKGRQPPPSLKKKKKKKND